MDPTKPAPKPKVGNAPGALPAANRPTVQPTKPFEATLAERKKASTSTGTKPSGKSTVQAAIEQATDPDEDLELGLRIVEEQLAIHMSRSVLQAPKPSKMSIEREKSEAEEDV